MFTSTPLRLWERERKISVYKHTHLGRDLILLIFDYVIPTELDKKRNRQLFPNESLCGVHLNSYRQCISNNRLKKARRVALTCTYVVGCTNTHYKKKWTESKLSSCKSSYGSDRMKCGDKNCTTVLLVYDYHKRHRRGENPQEPFCRIHCPPLNYYDYSSQDEYDQASRYPSSYRPSYRPSIWANHKLQKLKKIHVA